MEKPIKPGDSKREIGFEKNHARLHGSMVAWGANYIDLMLRVALPSLMAPGNLPFLCSRMEVLFSIYTRRADMKKIKSHPVFKRLSECCMVEVIPLIDELDPKPYPLLHMNDCQRAALTKANQESSPIMMFVSDVVASDGLGKTFYEALTRGYRVVVTQGQRLQQEALISFFEEKYGADCAVISLPPRELVRFAMRHLHPYPRHQFIDSRPFIYSAELYWRVGSSGILARNLGLAPMLVWPTNQEVLPGITFDDDYLGKAIPDQKLYYVIEDSDEGVLFSVTPEKRMSEAIPEKLNSFSYSAYARQIVSFFSSGNLGEIHLHYLRQRVRLHSEDLDEQWKRVEKESDRVVKKLLWNFRLEMARKKIWKPITDRIKRLTQAILEGIGRFTVKLTRLLLSPLAWIWSFFIFIRTLFIRDLEKRRAKRKILEERERVFLKKQKFFLRQRLWNFGWGILSCLSYQFGNRFRIGALRLFGAKVGLCVQIHSRVKIQSPWRLALGSGCVLSRGAILSGKNRIQIGEWTIVDREAILRTDSWCNGAYRPSVATWQSAPIQVGSHAYIGARAILEPGTVVDDQGVVPAHGWRRMGSCELDFEE